jgi:hypothetical protein
MWPESRTLNNEHGHSGGEHCHRRERHDDPSQAEARLAPHQLLIEAVRLFS